MFVLLSDGAETVGAVGVPVSAGEAIGARVVSVGWTWSSRDHFDPLPAAPVPAIVGTMIEASPWPAIGEITDAVPPAPPVPSP